MSTLTRAISVVVLVTAATPIETAAVASKTPDKKEATELAAKILNLSVSTGVSASWQDSALRIAAYPRDPDVWARGLLLEATSVEASKKLHRQRIEDGAAKPPNAVFTYSPQQQYNLFTRMRQLTQAHGGTVFIRLNRGAQAISVAENGFLQMPGLKDAPINAQAFDQTDLSKLFQQAARQASDFTQAMLATGNQNPVRKRGWLVELARESHAQVPQIRARYHGRLLNNIKATYLFPCEISPGKPVGVNIDRGDTRVLVIRRK